jgi:hypothetical protein
MANHKSSTASSDLSKLSGLLERKITIFRDFISATTSLKDMIELHNVEAVKMIIARRHDCISLIDKIDDEILKIRKANPSYEAPETRKRIQSLIKTLENMIASTLRLNHDCEAAVESELDKLRNDLSELGHSQKGIKGYRGKSGEPPRFMDVTT